MTGTDWTQPGSHATLPDGYTAAEINTGVYIHATRDDNRTLCDRRVYTTVDVTRWRVECSRCVKKLVELGAELVQPWNR